jgi:hypothetical protein
VLTRKSALRRQAIADCVAKAAMPDTSVYSVGLSTGACKHKQDKQRRYWRSMQCGSEDVAAQSMVLGWVIRGTVTLSPERLEAHAHRSSLISPSFMNNGYHFSTIIPSFVLQDCFSQCLLPLRLALLMPAAEDCGRLPMVTFT